MAGQQDLWPWLQSIMQNQGAGQPMNPNAIPGAAPQAMPGSGVNGMPAMTQGGPSMGFPAMGQPGPSPQAPFPAGPSPMSAMTPASPMMPPPAPTPDNAPNNLYQTASRATAPPRTSMPTASAVDSSGDDQPVSPRWENMPYPGQIDPRGYFAPKTAQGAAGSSGALPQTYPHMPWPDTGTPCRFAERHAAACGFGGERPAGFADEHGHADEAHGWGSESWLLSAQQPLHRH